MNSFHKKNFFIIFILLAITFFVHSPVLKNDFVNWDDASSLLENLSIRTLDREHAEALFTRTVMGVYTPLTFLSFALEYHFFEYNPFIYHLDNLILHLLVVLCVFFFFRQLGLSLWTAAVAALIFGIHPSRVESVAWVTERKDVLYGLFYLLSCIAYVSYANAVAHKGRKRYAVLILSFVLGTLSMMAKPMALSLPVILLLLDWYLGRKDKVRMLVEKIPFFLIIGGLTWITYSLHKRIPGENVGEGFLIWAWTFTFYPRQFLFPFISIPIQRLPYPIAISHLEYSLSLMVLVLFGVSLFLFRRRRGYVFSFFFFFLSIFFLFRFDEAKDVTIVADRFSYLPSLGFCFLIGLGLEAWMRQSWFVSRKFRGGLAAAVLIGVVGWLSIKTFYLSAVWKDSLTLWQHQLKYAPGEYLALNNLADAIKQTPAYKEAESRARDHILKKREGARIQPSRQTLDSLHQVSHVISLIQKAILINPKYERAYYNLGEVYKDLGMYHEALNAYRKVISLNPEFKEVYFGLGNLYRDIGDPQAAVEAYTKNLSVAPEAEDPYIDVVLAYNEALLQTPEQQIYLDARRDVINRFTELINKRPGRATSFFNLGYLYSETDDLDRAVLAYRMVLDINPRHFKALYNLGNVYKDTGQLRQAIRYYKEALQINPRVADVYLNLGIVYGRLGQNDLAQQAYQKAIKMNPEEDKAYFNWGYIEEKEGFWLEAIQKYKQALKINPDNAEAYYNMGNIYYKQKKLDPAFESYKKAVAIDPQHLNAHVNLSIVSFGLGRYQDAVKYCDEAILLGYDAPLEYLNTLQKYREK